MNRRSLLSHFVTSSAVVLAGCVSGDSSSSSSSKEATDTDGDGVPDQYDYAPRDPEVQSKSDTIQSTRTSISTPTSSPTPARTPTATPSPTPTATPTATPTPTPKPRGSNTIRADSAAVVGFTHHLTEYSSEHATVRIYGTSDFEKFDGDAEVLAVAQGYPGSQSERIIEYFRSDRFSPPTGGETTITVDFTKNVESEVPFFYYFILIPGGSRIEDISPNSTEMLCESDRLQVDTSGELQREPHPHEKSDVSTRRYKRTNVEGGYILEFNGSSFYTNWSVTFIAFKHGYIEDIYAIRYNDRRDYVYETLNEGLANGFGALLAEEADANGFTGDREQVEFLIDFVQNLPYVPDDVSTGFDDYTKRTVESLVDGGGDCEDSSVMLASLLLSDSFGYGTALVRLPAHMAVGVKGDEETPGTYYEKDGVRYFYIETTGSGWGVGEIPEEYDGVSAYVFVL